MSAIERYRKGVSLWLYGMAVLVFGMIALGGLTRLTESGLSMVEWRPLMGVIPPIGDSAWQSVFEKYKAYPEYQQLNVGMTMKEFKFIFYFEYGHRILGRLIGMAFAFPALFFWMRGAFSTPFRNRIIILFFLGGLQGVVGWWMVKSGLVDRPDVSHYRLTTHLSLAVFLYIALLWTALRHHSNTIRTQFNDGAQWSAGLLVMVFVTLISGGLVAGLNAGAQYNTFPLMGGKWIPDGLFIRMPWVSNLTENLVTVQFNHRYFALTTAALILVFSIRKLVGDTLSKRQKISLILMVCAVGLQVSLGIMTLLSGPIIYIPYASSHQMGAILLITSLVWGTHELSSFSQEYNGDEYQSRPAK